MAEKTGASARAVGEIVVAGIAVVPAYQLAKVVGASGFEGRSLLPLPILQTGGV